MGSIDCSTNSSKIFLLIPGSGASISSPATLQRSSAVTEQAVITLLNQLTTWKGPSLVKHIAGVKSQKPLARNYWESALARRCETQIGAVSPVCFCIPYESRANRKLNQRAARRARRRLLRNLERETRMFVRIWRRVSPVGGKITWTRSRRSVLVAGTWWSSSTARVGRYTAR